MTGRRCWQWAAAMAVAWVATSGCPDESPPTSSGPSTGGAGGPTVIRQGGTERPERLILGLTPYLPGEKLREEYTPLMEHIGRAVALPTEIRPASSYAELSRMVQAHEVHLAVLSPFNYVRAKRESPGLILLATHIAEGSSTYSAYIVAREADAIASVHDLKGKRFGFVDRSSASGYLYPLAYLRNLGYEPDTLFSSVEFAGNHQRLIDLVLTGKVDAGATFSTAFKIASNKRLRILAKTGRIPYDAYCASPRLEQGLVETVRSTLLRLNTRSDTGRRILAGLTNINGFVAVTDDHYDEVRRVERLVKEATPTTP